MREFLKAPFLVLHFSYYTLMIFLTMLSVILLSMLMILLSILSVIGHLICGNNLNWLLTLNLIYETLDWGKKWLVDFNAGKTQLLSFDRSNNDGSIDVKMDEFSIDVKMFLRKNYLLRCRLFLNRFSVPCNLFCASFLVTPCLVVAVQPCMQ